MPTRILLLVLLLSVSSRAATVDHPAKLLTSGVLPGRAAPRAPPFTLPVMFTETLVASARAMGASSEAVPTRMAPRLTIRSSPAPPAMPRASTSAVFVAFASAKPTATPFSATAIGTETLTERAEAAASTPSPPSCRTASPPSPASMALASAAAIPELSVRATPAATPVA